MDIKETKEALVAANEIGVQATKLFKDGVQVNDFEQFYATFITDADFKAKVKAGWDGRDKISAEVKDIDLVEGLELAQVQLSYVSKFVDALK